MNRILLLSAAMLTAFGQGVQAKVKLHHLVSDHMVIQADSKVNLWGWDAPGKTVKVTVSWSKDKYQAQAGQDGKWCVKVQTPQASYTPLSITFDDGDRTTVSDVLAGQVWLCGGQSNMEMPLRGFGGCPVEGYNETVAGATATASVRFAKMPRLQSMKPLDDSDVEWRLCDPANVADASATAYYFGRMLHSVLDQPVGLIEANQGGTAVEGWLNEQNLREHTGESLDSAQIFAKHFMERQLVWGNGTMHPVLGYGIKGIIFYQGCSNVGRSPQTYAERLALLVKQWRDGFGQGQLPFYYVEIAPFDYGYQCEGKTDGAYLREQQFKAQQLIPGSIMVSNNDGVYADEVGQIHPRQKRKVGERLAWCALGDAYGLKGYIYRNPSYKAMTIDGSRVRVTFDNTFGGICPRRDIAGFEVAGEDKVFHKANAWVDGDDTVVCESSEVPQPVAVRYCYRNFLLGNVTNQGNLPLVPFRSDQW